MSKHEALRPTFDPSTYELIEALSEAEAALEMLGHDIPIKAGRFIPTGTLALQSVRKALSHHPDMRLHAERSSWATCEGCGEPAEHADEDGVGTCQACLDALKASA